MEGPVRDKAQARWRPKKTVVGRLGYGGA
jgi:hypothetical protein